MMNNQDGSAWKDMMGHTVISVGDINGVPCQIIARTWDLPKRIKGILTGELPGDKMPIDISTTNDLHFTLDGDEIKIPVIIGSISVDEETFSCDFQDSLDGEP